jgi:WD40 repeat protein
MPQRLAPVLVAALLASAAAAATAQPVLINSGHVGAVTALRYDAARRLLFSAGEDGSVRVWSHARRSIVGQVRLGMNPVDRIAVHPARPLLAAVVTTGSGTQSGARSIGVWNWSTGQRLFARLVEEEPLHFGFTSRGTALVYTRARFDSVVFLDPLTGEVRGRTWEPFGIVSFVTTSTNERTVMTYKPTGLIQYRDARSGALSAQVGAPPGLDRISISHDKAFMVARDGPDLVVVDVVTGRVRGRVAVPDALGFAVSERISELTLLRPARTGSRDETVADRLQIDRGLRRRVSGGIALEGAATAVAYGDRSVFIADQGGIAELYPRGGTERVLRNELLTGVQLAAVEGRAGRPDVVLAATGDRLILARFRSSPRSDSRLPASLGLQVIRNPFGTPVGVTAIPPAAGGTTPFTRRATFLIWPRAGATGTLATVDPSSGAVRYRLTGLEAPVRQVSVMDDERLLVLDSAGTIRLYSLRAVLAADRGRPVRPLQRFWAPGARTVVGSANRLIAARSASNLAAPLLHVDTDTEETLPLSLASLLVYDLALLDNGLLVSLGVAKEGRRTVLEQHFGRHAAHSRVIDAYPGEDLFAALAVAPDRRQVYSSLGEDTVRAWDGNTLLDLEQSGHRPRQLTVTDTLLVSVNADASFTVWDRARRSVLFNLYLFRDLEWLAVSPPGEVAQSRGADRYVVTPYGQ